MRRSFALIVAPAMLLLSAAAPAQTQTDAYYWFHEGIASTDIQEQVSHFSSAIADRPGHVEAWLGLAVAHYDGGLYARAADVLEKMHAKGMRNRNTEYVLACCYSLLGNLDAAVQHFLGAVRLGFRDHELFRADRDLDPIRTHPDIMRLMGPQTVAMR